MLLRRLTLSKKNNSVRATTKTFTRTKSTLSYDEIIKDVQKSGAKKVKLNIVDIDGVLRGKYVSLDKFASGLKSGISFCSVVFGWDVQDKCYDNSKFAGWHTGYPDVTAVIDPGTYRKVPWEDNTPFFLMDFDDANGNPLSVCPRKLLRKVLGQVEKEHGATVTVGPELEFYNYNESNISLIQKSYSQMEHLTPGMFGYSSLRTGQNYEYFQKIFNELLEFGVEVEGLHTETGPGVLEVAIGCDNALAAADKAVLFKYGLKLIGSRMNIYPCFMAKPHKNLPGNSGHLHQSFESIKDKKNLFYDANDRHKMSELFKHYVAGQLHCMTQIMPMYCPTINSYKRLVEGYWAPVQPTWGVENRTTSLRVIPGSEKSTRIETRIAGADANPYLSISAAIASGLYGIRHKLKLEDEVVGTKEISEESRLPRNLWEATNKMKNSAIANELFGEEFVDHFVRTREWEWREYQTSVTNWELERYSEII